MDAYPKQRDRLAGNGSFGEGEDSLTAPPPLRAILTGTAGTGKTVVINSMVRTIGAEKSLLFAPTGCAACNIGSQTVHIGLKFPVRPGRGSTADGSQMSATGTRALQDRIRGVEFILVDEMSIVSQGLLGLMSIWGRQAVEGRTPDGDDDRARGIFGELNFILAVDPMQPPPVGGATIWAERPSDAGHTIEGRVVWLGMNVG